MARALTAYDRSMHRRPIHGSSIHRSPARLAPLPLLALVLTLVLALVLGCTGGSEGDATSEPTLPPTEAATIEPTTEPTATPTPTPSPTPEPTPTPIPAVQPDATASGASFLWSGAVTNPGIPWTSMRVTVGADPLVDPWQFTLGVTPVTEFQCWPTPIEGATEGAEGGIALNGCGRVFSATVDVETNEMTVAFNEPATFGSRWVEAVLRPV